MVENNRSKVQQHKQSPLGKKPLETFIGSTIRLKTAFDEEVEGLIYTCDRITNCIVIDCSHKDNKTSNRKNCNFRIIKISHIKEILFLTATTNGVKDYMPINQIYIDRLKQRESEVMKGVKNEVSKIGIGVTKEGQDIFNALSKTLPCRWSKDTIIVMDEILITPPYGVNDCKANASSSALLARIKKVLEGERKRLAK
ncbi:anticodon-binding domain-containing protein [Cokeromyces recurvatus]|uniref:anticodon-binding domain-containing protein n=1 Tax=Cokeromyces recurvatus TaxID=90255 RepID=UPI0022202F21|nr:anticodon-binding domain-containing protein [Cokeromyces recurvatus]KAI7902996.1 anticodon-binding domain-containing protein [Cokeromyces recurvatus]